MRASTSTATIPSLPPLGLYVHIPWCVRKCPYCDFNSHETAQMPEDAYVETLGRDLAAQAHFAQGRELQSIFFGGGTPSLFSGASVAAILDHVRGHLALAPEIEITLEANPGTAEQQRFRDYRAAGVNRLSIGVQSFDDARLQALGRIHSGAEAIAAVRAARAAGFDNLNIDLMHGLPGQSIAGAVADLDLALELDVEHLSWYQLTLEPNTAFYTRPPTLPDAEQLADILDAGLARLQAAGMARYEVSAYARKPHLQARHNLNYWHFGDYLGIGAGAHAKVTQASGRILRYNATRTPRDYLRSAGRPWPSRELDQQDLVAEFMLNALRLRQGFAPTLFRERTGLDWGVIEARVAEQCHRGLLELEAERLRPTPRGFDFLDDVITAFL